jgi:hypothetical protein
VRTKVKQFATSSTLCVALAFSLGIFAQAYGDVPSSSKPSFKFLVPSPWKETTLHEADAAWTIPQSPTHASITVTSDVADGDLDLAHFDEGKMVGLVEKTRAVYFYMFGITNWKVDRHHYTTSNSGSNTSSVLEMDGHYNATSGTPVHFVERDFFVGRKSYTITFFEDVNGSALQSDSDVRKVLDRSFVPRSRNLCGDGRVFTHWSNQPSP